MLLKWRTCLLHKYSASRVKRPFFESDITPPLRHAHFSSSLGASRCFLLLVACFQCTLSASRPIFAVCDCATLESCLRFTPLVTGDAIHERSLTSTLRIPKRCNVWCFKNAMHHDPSGANCLCREWY